MKEEGGGEESIPVGGEVGYYAWEGEEISSRQF